MAEHKVEFGTLHSDGTVTNVRRIKQSDIARCPHCIFMPSHYNDDGSCQCGDPSAHEMKEWGYTWKDGQWR
jgi:hypothetical protein